MDLDQVLECVRPLTCRSDDPEFPIFGKGTCFLTRFKSSLWIVAAAHSMRDKRADRLIVPVNIEAWKPIRELEIEGVSVPRDAAETDPHWPSEADADDVIAFRCVPPGEDVIAVDLEDGLAPVATIERGDHVRICGFPAALENEILYEERQLSYARLFVDCTYDEPAPWAGLHRLALPDQNLVATLDGMSGSPAFFVKRGASEFSFLGMLLRADVSQRAAYVLDWRKIARLIVPHI